MKPHSLVGLMHGRMVFRRRIQVLARAIAPALRRAERVLDVGCGTGELAILLKQIVGDLDITGVEVGLRNQTAIPVMQYDGRTLPFGDKSIDVAVLVDVLHHAEDARAVLRETARVSRRAVIIKDHIRTGRVSQLVLSFMDWIGNAPHGVAMSYRYFSDPEWRDMFHNAGLALQHESRRLGLYPWPASAVFERGYHFVAVLDVPARGSGVERSVTQSAGSPALVS